MIYFFFFQFGLGQDVKEYDAILQLYRCKKLKQTEKFQTIFHTADIPYM